MSKGQPAICLVGQIHRYPAMMGQNSTNLLYTRLATSPSRKIYAKLTQQPAATPHLGHETDFREVLDKKGVGPAQDCL
jgi:hypothetical protein